MHGGKALVGTAVKHLFKDGRYSRYLPARLQQTYDKAVEDPNLLSLRHDIGLVDSRLVDLLSRVDTGESGQLWRNLKAAHEEFRVATGAQDVSRMHQTLAKVEALLDSGVQDHLAWGEVAKLLDQRRMLVESEQKRMQSLHQMLTAEEALLMAKQFIDIMTRHVTDKKALSAIIVEMQRMLGGGYQAKLSTYAEARDE